MTTIAGDSGATGARRTPSGLERQGLKATGIVLAIVLFFTAGLSLIDAIIPAPGEQVGAGKIVNLAGRARFAPATDWEVESSSDAARGNYAIARDGIEFAIVARTSDRSAIDLLKVYQDAVRKSYSTALFGDAKTVTTGRGLNGVECAISAVNVAGLIDVFSKSGTFVATVVIGPRDTVVKQQNSIAAMLNSIEVL